MSRRPGSDQPTSSGQRPGSDRRSRPPFDLAANGKKGESVPLQAEQPSIRRGRRLDDQAAEQKGSFSPKLTDHARSAAIPEGASPARLSDGRSDSSTPIGQARDRMRSIRQRAIDGYDSFMAKVTLMPFVERTAARTVIPLFYGVPDRTRGVEENVKAMMAELERRGYLPPKRQWEDSAGQNLDAAVDTPLKSEHQQPTQKD